MKKVLIIVSIGIIILLSGCGNLREKLLAPPDEMTIPDGSLVAICEKEDIIYKHIYQNDGIYVYYIDGIVQDEDVLDEILEQAYLHGESMANYLTAEYGVDGCEIEDYVESTTE